MESRSVRRRSSTCGPAAWVPRCGSRSAWRRPSSSSPWPGASAVRRNRASPRHRNRSTGMSMTEPAEPADLARSSAWMALGTVVSRVTGFVRLLLIAFTIGTALDADLFNNANTIPNALYILVAGGIFNVVLVPQLVRAMKNDPDGGDAYAQRIVTLGLLVLAAATVVLLLVVPGLVHVVFD